MWSRQNWLVLHPLIDIDVVIFVKNHRINQILVRSSKVVFLSDAELCVVVPIEAEQNPNLTTGFVLPQAKGLAPMSQGMLLPF